VLFRSFAVLRRLGSEGVAVVLITHKLNEVLAIADRITVMRRGQVVGRAEAASANAEDLTRWMFGAALGDELRLSAVADVRAGDHLDIQNLSVLGDDGRVAVDHVSLHVASGEILGLAGVSGNGQLEFVEAIAGVRSAVAGAISLGGKSLRELSPRQLRDRGLVYIPEERDAGVIGELPMQDNLVLADYHRRQFSRLGILRWRPLRQFAFKLVERFRLPPDRVRRPVRWLSGGNQQRVVLARSLAGRPAVLIAAQATQGLDLATTRYVHELVSRLRDEGVGVLYVSTDIDELLELCDRIAVVFHGRVVGVMERREFSRRTIGYLMTAGRVAGPSAGSVA